MSVGLEPEVRVWPRCPALPVAEQAGQKRVLRPTRDEGVRAEDIRREPQTDTGTKIFRPHVGVAAFILAEVDGLEPEVRVWPRCPALPVAEQAGQKRVLRPTRDEGVRAEDIRREPQTDTGTISSVHNGFSCCEHLIFPCVSI